MDYINWVYFEQIIVKSAKFGQNTLETSLICILLLTSRDVHFDKRMICFLSDLL